MVKGRLWEKGQAWGVFVCVCVCSRERAGEGGEGKKRGRDKTGRRKDTIPKIVSYKRFRRSKETATIFRPLFTAPYSHSLPQRTSQPKWELEGENSGRLGMRGTVAMAKKKDV